MESSKSKQLGYKLRSNKWFTYKESVYVLSGIITFIWIINDWFILKSEWCFCLFLNKRNKHRLKMIILEWLIVWKEISIMDHRDWLLQVKDRMAQRYGNINKIL